MNKETRNAIERATQRARKLLEEDFASQLEGKFDVLRNGTVAAKAGPHLTTRQIFQRNKIVAAIEHKRTAGMSAAEAVVDYLRDAAFTALNRFVALKMLEARELVQECITKGDQSAGYREFCGLAPGAALLPDGAGYRLYIESLFDELATEIKVLFDRRDTASVLWPKRGTFEALLAILNVSDLASVWGEDETIGWVYQFFNSGEERKRMRDESQAPRNSRELAVRNQFFTPRYVVQFLADNTLGRIWFEMRAGETTLVDRSEYMVRLAGETYAPRAKKDPRDLRVLDPACGSGHFLLYAFDLLLTIYEEAYHDADGQKSEATGNTLAADYSSIETLRKALPALVLAHNLYGVDIDARCTQIAQLALWMRAQRAFRDFSVGLTERPLIRRSNIVVAEPLVTDAGTLQDFLAKLGDAELRRVFTELIDTLKLAGDLGLLLRLEALSRKTKIGQTGELFAPPEARILEALARFAADASVSTRRRFFVDDAAQGVGLLETAEKRFDVVLMNPPFGEPAGKLPSEFRGLPKDLYCCFIERASTLLCAGGRVGALTSASFRTYIDYESFRARFFISGHVAIMADLGWGVLDGAYVETAAYVMEAGRAFDRMTFIDLRDAADRAQSLKNAVQDQTTGRSYILNPGRFDTIAGKPLIYWWSDATWNRLAAFPRFGSLCRAIGKGAGPHAIFYRLRWEVRPESIGLNRRWVTFTNGGAFSPFRREDSLLLHWENHGALVKGYLLQRYPYLDGNTEWNIQMEDYFGHPGLTYGKKTTSFSMQVMPAGSVFSFEGIGVFPASEDDTWWLLAYMNSEFVRWYLNATCGLHKNPPYVRNVPVPLFEPSAKEQLAELARAGWAARVPCARHDERSPFFRAPWRTATGNIECDDDVARILSKIDSIVDLCIGLNSSELLGKSVSTMRSVDQDDGAEPDDLVATEAAAWSSWAVGVAFGRFEIESAKLQVTSVSPGPFAPLPTRIPSTGFPSHSGIDSVHTILVDDPGHIDDLTAATSAVLEHIGQSASEDLGKWLSRDFFAFHIKNYSKARRKAPIYWQLATPSASYSVWLYLHALTNDTLYKVQNDYLAPKIGHEERKLESLRRELGESPGPGERKALALQEILVEELRTFLGEIIPVAPLWNPNLDDGVVIAMAPLWRLVPQYKPWQKELKTKWEELSAGKYDWAHLAMHLWPERVVPRCATDRSLAIAHGLEDVFWVEGANGKWMSRPTPVRTVDELVVERSSAAVKAALKSLLEAPSPGAYAKRTPRGKPDA